MRLPSIADVFIEPDAQGCLPYSQEAPKQTSNSHLPGVLTPQGPVAQSPEAFESADGEEGWALPSAQVGLWVAWDSTTHASIFLLIYVCTF